MSPSIKILVVDDQEHERKTLAAELREFGFDVVMASGGREALELLETEHSDIRVVLTDVQMPEMTGIELTKKIKTNYPQIDIIVITAQGEVDVVVEAVQAGAANYLVKPPKILEVKRRIDKLIEQQIRIEIGSEKKELSILFSDIRNFTELSEKIDLKVLSQFLNEYLAAMTEILHSNNGTLDKYIGDSVMGFWGASSEVSNHAEMAVKTAVDMLEKLVELNVGFLQKYQISIDIGVAVNSGIASVGNIGSKKVSEFTVIGDNVNLASRLESINRYYGTHITISESTYLLLNPNQYLCRKIDTVRLKGKRNSVNIYEIIQPSIAQAGIKEAFAAYQAGLAHYYLRNWNEAIACFQEAVQMRKEDGPASVLLKRCVQFLESAPGDDWDGVWEMHLK